MSSKEKNVAEWSSSSASFEIEEVVKNLTASLKKIVLNSCDGESFEIDDSVAREFQIIAHMMEDNCAGKAIPVENISEAGVIDENDEEAEKKLAAWDTEFMEKLDLETIFNLLIAANYLNFQGLLDCASQTVADFIKDKEPEEVREIFNIENDFTPEEEAAIRWEYAWTFNKDDPDSVSTDNISSV